MIEITKEEKEQLVKAFPNLCVVRTEKQRSQRRRYYCEEYWPAMKMLKRMRGEYIPKSKGKGRGGKRGAREKK